MKKEKTIHELVKEFPDRSYRELEIYRDADRNEEASRIPLTESQKSQEDLEPISKGVCVTGALRKDLMGSREYQKEHTLRQEAEGELSILKGIETNRVKEALARCDHLSLELDRIKKDNVNLYSRVAELIEVNESHQKLNGKLQEGLTELEEENKKLHDHLDKRIDNARKSGM